MKFSSIDRSILKEAMGALQFWERQVLIYRYWENLSIDEIAMIMDMKWSEVDMSIENTFKILRKYCLNEPAFSLSSTCEEAA